MPDDVPTFVSDDSDTVLVRTDKVRFIGLMTTEDDKTVGVIALEGDDRWHERRIKEGAARQIIRRLRQK